LITFLNTLKYTISNAIVTVIYEILYNMHKIGVKVIPVCNSVEIQFSGS